MTEPAELYLKHRPQRMADIVGQPSVLSTIKGFGGPEGVPHVLLLSGPSGCGKTTIARIIAGMLKIGKQDLAELNAAESRGIDDIRDIQQRMRLSPLQGKYRGYIFDECHKLTGDAQTCLLKTLEDYPPHVYFFLCTTDPKKILATIKGRCTEIKLAPILAADLKKLVVDVASKEGKPVSEEVAGKIAEAALAEPPGGARKALVILKQVLGIPSDKQMEAITKNDPTATGFEVAQKIFSKAKWGDVAAVLKSAKDAEQDAEGIRRVILGYAQAILLKGANRKAYEVIEAFWAPLYDIGWPGLVSRCFECVEGRS